MGAQLGQKLLLLLRRLKGAQGHNQAGAVFEGQDEIILFQADFNDVGIGIELVKACLLYTSRLLSAPVKFVSSLLPFCLLELLLLGIPLSALGLLVWDLVRRKRAPARGQEADRSDEGFWALVSAALSVFFVMMTIFQLTLGVGYHTLTLEEQLGYPDTPVTAQSLSLIHI